MTKNKILPVYFTKDDLFDKQLAKKIAGHRMIKKN